MKRTLLTLLCLAVFSSIPSLYAAPPTAKERAARAKAARAKAAAERKRKQTFAYRFPEGVTQTADSEKRVDQWYRDAKYGAFIHWGVYSMLEGQYKNGRGKEHRYSEWIRFSAKIPHDEYHALARTFNPTRFDAEEWVMIFKDAGIRYVVITSKHHDGFCLFKSTVNDFNIVDGTPFKRDVIQELTDACHQHGLKMGVYYSHAQDWDEPDAPYLNPRTKLSELHPKLPADFQQDMDRYLEKKSLKQVEELVTHYELDLIWFDTPVGMTIESARRFRDLVRKHRPHCLINSRIINKGKDRTEQNEVELFDYVSIGDKEVPNQPLSLYFESPDSVSTSYAYKKYGEVSYHSVPEMIQRLVHTVCSNGNYLLNNGPLGNGRLDPEAIRIYRAIGEWLKPNAESIYHTRANPLPARPAWGDVCVSKDGKQLYLHVMYPPADGKIAVKGLETKVKSAEFLVNGQRLKLEQVGNTVSLALRTKQLDPYDTVIKLTLDK